MAKRANCWLYYINCFGSIRTSHFWIPFEYRGSADFNLLHTDFNLLYIYS